MEIASTLYDCCEDLSGKNLKIGFRLMQYRHRRVGNDCDFRTSWLANLYNVQGESATLYLSLKPWRFITPQRHRTNIEVSVCDDMSTELLQKLSYDGLLAPSIMCLNDLNGCEFNAFHKILSRLRNIRHLNVTLMCGSATSQEIGRALNDLPRLRGLRIWIASSDQHTDWSGAVLFKQLRHGDIRMYSVDIPSPYATTLAYKSLEIEVETEHVEKWTQYAHLCTKLLHFTIRQYSVDLMPLIPPNLVSLAASSSSMFFRTTQSPQTQLRRLLLSVASFPWDAMALWCPNVRLLELRFVKIHGPITVSLPVTNLILFDVSDNSHFSFVRRMCQGRLHRVEISARKAVLAREFRDWIVHPEFLIGAYVAWGWDSIVRKFLCKRKMNSRKRAVLYFRDCLLVKNNMMPD